MRVEDLSSFVLCASNTSTANMRFSLLGLLLGLLTCVSALSASGRQLLVVVEDEAADKAKYSQLWNDLSSKYSRQN